MLATGEWVYAHRFAYERTKGPLPAGCEPDHLCHHTWCVRPSHLEGVTHRENMRRMRYDPRRYGSANRRKTACPQGHPYDDVNTCLSGGRRYCRACARANHHARKARAG